MTAEPVRICWQETTGGGDYQNNCPGVAVEHQSSHKTQTAAGQATCSGQDLWTVWDQRHLEDPTEKHSDWESNICRVSNHEQMDENKSVERGVNKLQDKDEKSCKTWGTPSQRKYIEMLFSEWLNCILCWYLLEEWSGQD